MRRIKLKEKIEILEIKLKHLKNDYLLTKEENETSTKKYLEILLELEENNAKLQNLQKNLEKIVEERTSDLRKSEKMLKEKNEEQEVMLNSSPAMIFYKNGKINIFVLIKHLLKLWGFLQMR